MNPDDASSPTNQTNQTTSNHTTWRWNGTSWDAVEVACKYGFVPSHPSGAGSYPGETQVTECVQLRRTM